MLAGQYDRGDNGAHDCRGVITEAPDLRPLKTRATAKQMALYSRVAVYTGINHSESNETRAIYSLPDLIYYSVKEPYENSGKSSPQMGKKPALNW